MGDIDVDALLAHADALVRTGAHDNRVLAGVAAALRAERERASNSFDHGLDEQHRRIAAERHLRAVLDWCWPEGTTGPACVREARAHLAGEAPSKGRDEHAGLVAAEMRAQSASDEATELRRRIGDMQGAVRNIGRDLDAARVELATEQEQHGHTRTTLADTRQRLWTLEAGIAALAATMKAGRA